MFGGDLYVANLAQSWFVTCAMTLLMASQIIRLPGSDWDTYKAVYFASAFCFVLSGATTMLSRGCGSFYFLGRSPGFSARDQVANFIYVTASVLLLVVASWQVDYGEFTFPMRIAESVVFVMWLIAGAYYTAADAHRLVKETNKEAMVDEDDDEDEHGATTYVRMGGSPVKYPLRSGEVEKQTRAIDLVERARTRSSVTIQTGKDRRSWEARQNSWGRMISPFHLRKGGSWATGESDIGPNGSLPTVSTYGDYSLPSVEMGTLQPQRTFSTSDEHSAVPSVADSAIKPKKGRSWRSRLGFGGDAYCGPSCDPIVMDPASGPPRKIPGRDGDSVSAHGSVDPRYIPGRDFECNRSSSMPVVVLSDQAGSPSNVNESSPALSTTIATSALLDDEYTASPPASPGRKSYESGGSAYEDASWNHVPGGSAAGQTTVPDSTSKAASSVPAIVTPSESSPPPEQKVQKKKSKKFRTMFWADREIV